VALWPERDKEIVSGKGSKIVAAKPPSTPGDRTSAGFIVYKIAIDSHPGNP